MNPVFAFLLLTSPLIAQPKDEGLRQIGVALDMYFMDCNTYPATEDGLQALRAPTLACGHGWGPDPYIKVLPNDKWGRPYVYRQIDRKHYELRSLGADGREGGVGENMDVILSPTR